MAGVKEKKVELIELFYDLIYVYAVSRLTMLIEEPENGIIPVMGFLRYLVVCFVILQAWLYLTNYVNRYGTWTWYEYALTAVNMTAAVYMANTISADWNGMALTFNLAMLAMLLCVAVLYVIQTRLRPAEAGAAKNSLTNLGIVLCVYLAACAAVLLGATDIAIWIDIAAVLAGAFLPFFIRGKFDAGIISFPHLVERFELLTIVTFGEGVVSMTGFFDVRYFTLRPILIFAVILTLYGSYVTQIHYLCEHHQTARALRLMFSHYFVVIAVNLVTVDLKLLENPESSHRFTAIMMLCALCMFYCAIFSDRCYYKSAYRFEATDGLRSLGIAIAGAAIILAFRDSLYAFLFGTLFITAGNFALLLKKYHGGANGKDYD